MIPMTAAAAVAAQPAEMAEMAGATQTHALVRPKASPDSLPSDPPDVKLDFYVFERVIANELDFYFCAVMITIRTVTIVLIYSRLCNA